MSKDEAKDEMKKKNFNDFLGKTSRIIERELYSFNLEDRQKMIALYH